MSAVKFIVSSDGYHVEIHIPHDMQADGKKLLELAQEVVTRFWGYKLGEPQ